MDKKDAKYERIKSAIKWLIGNGIAPNQFEIGKLLGYTNESAFSKVVNGKVPLPPEFTYKLCKLDKNRTLNETWVSEGWGSMIDKTRSFLSEELRESFNKNEVNEPLPTLNCKSCSEKQSLIDQLIGENNILREQLNMPIPERNKKVS